MTSYPGLRFANVVFVTLTLLALLTLAGCATAEGAATGTPNFTDPNQPIVVAPGQRFTITLDANPTTGYQWQLATPPDAAVVSYVGAEYMPPQSNQFRPGAGTRQVWTFQGVQPGVTRIDLQYVRPWEKGVDPVQRKTFDVQVK